MMDGTAVTFVSRRDANFRSYPPASAQAAIVVPFFGGLAVWVRPQQNRGWQFPAGGRRSGETIVEAARRQLWDATRFRVPKLDLIGCLAYTNGRSRVAYVYACQVERLPWSYERPEDGVEVGVFVRTPKPIEGDWCLTLLDVVQRARKGGLT